MKKFSCSIIAVALASIFTVPLAIAEQAKKSAAPVLTQPKPVLTQPKIGPTSSGPQMGLRQGQGMPNSAGAMRAGEQRKVAGAHPRGFDRDPRHWTGRDRAAWHGGHAYHDCRFGHCGYWWWADGYWYFYDYPVYGAPELVSEIAYDDQGNPVQAAAQDLAGPGVPVLPPPAADPSTAASAIIGGVVGGILGNALGGR